VIVAVQHWIRFVLGDQGFQLSYCPAVLQTKHMYSHVQINLGQFYFSRVMWGRTLNNISMDFLLPEKFNRFHLFVKVDK
jgi:hypothetical protein